MYVSYFKEIGSELMYI